MTRQAMIDAITAILNHAPYALIRSVYIFITHAASKN